MHPEYRRRGIGRMLLSHAVMHASAQAAGRLDAWAYNSSPASVRLAEQFGFTPARRLRHLHRHAKAEPPAPRRRGGGDGIRAFRPGDDDARWVALNNRIFSSHPENGAWTLDDLRVRMRQPWFEPGDFLIREHDGQISSFFWLKVEERGDDGRVGEIYVLGVAPEQRGRGHARELLAQGLACIAERGAATAAVYVDEGNAAALSLYEAAGFHHHHVDICYTRAVAGATRSVAEDAA